VTQSKDDSQTQNPSTQIETIIVAEDSLPNRKILQLLLTKMNYNVFAYSNGKEAWERIKDPATPNIVAVLSDLMMPEEDGMSLLKKIRADEQTKHLPFVFVTAVSDKDLVKMAKNYGVQGYILKPVTYLRVSSKLQELFPTRIFPKVAS
jgi:CheY-like chemotaxis protein